VQSFGSTQLDASTLLIPLVGFLPPSDERVSSTVDAIGRHLMRDCLVLRYDTRAHAMASRAARSVPRLQLLVCRQPCPARRHREARELFENLLSLRNDVAARRRIHTPTGRLVGNFPQAFSHVR
jgi:GH15 family glucan-1,4-alpha-glucosidase